MAFALCLRERGPSRKLRARGAAPRASVRGGSGGGGGLPHLHAPPPRRGARGTALARCPLGSELVSYPETWALGSALVVRGGEARLPWCLSALSLASKTAHPTSKSTPRPCSGPSQVRPREGQDAGPECSLCPKPAGQPTSPCGCGHVARHRGCANQAWQGVGYRSRGAAETARCKVGDRPRGWPPPWHRCVPSRRRPGSLSSLGLAVQKPPLLLRVLDAPPRPRPWPSAPSAPSARSVGGAHRSAPATCCPCDHGWALGSASFLCIFILINLFF